MPVRMATPLLFSSGGGAPDWQRAQAILGGWLEDRHRRSQRSEHVGGIRTSRAASDPLDVSEVWVSLKGAVHRVAIPATHAAEQEGRRLGLGGHDQVPDLDVVCEPHEHRRMTGSATFIRLQLHECAPDLVGRQPADVSYARKRQGYNPFPLKRGRMPTVLSSPNDPHRTLISRSHPGILTAGPRSRLRLTPKRAVVTTPRLIFTGGHGHAR